MDNPFEVPAPKDPMARVHEFARDLAYGALHGFWTSRFRQKTDQRISAIDSGNDLLDIVLRNKWQGNPPRISLLESFGYVTLYVKESDSRFSLTMRAFSLLEAPMKPIRAFVSYRRQQSSALAIAVEARLKLADHNMDIFVDKNIPVGQQWEEELRNMVQTADYFIALIGAETLSPNVMDEIEWALDANCRIVTIMHPGFRFEQIANPDARQQNIITELNKRQMIVIDSESAEHYDSAIRKLLNTLGYSTL